MKHFFLFCSAFVLSAPALAEPFTYAPENCEFQITFPEKPFIETKCTTEKNDCAEIVSYTKVANAESSTHFRVTCNPLSATEVETYTPEILGETLKQMLKSNGLEAFDTKTSNKDGYKSAITLSISERDGKLLIYNGQIWTGKKSMFTLEAEMLGSQNDDIDKTFAAILKNAYPKDRPPKGTEPTKEKTTEKKQ